MNKKRFEYSKPSIEVIELQSEGILCLSVLGQGTGEGNENGFENEEDNPENIW